MGPLTLYMSYYNLSLKRFSDGNKEIIFGRSENSILPISNGIIFPRGSQEMQAWRYPGAGGCVLYEKWRSSHYGL